MVVIFKIFKQSKCSLAGKLQVFGQFCASISNKRCLILLNLDKFLKLTQTFYSSPSHDRTEVALNKSRLLLKIVFKTHKHYNYLLTMLKQKVFTKFVKMPSSEAWVERSRNTQLTGDGAQRFESEVRTIQLNIRQCFT